MNRLSRVVLGSLRSTEPEALPEEIYWRSVWPVLLLAVSVGLQATVVAMAALGPLAPQIPPELLTQMGRANMRPEWDLEAFYAGCIFTVLLCFFAVRLWNARLRREDGARAALSGSLFHALAAAVSLWAFLALMGSLRTEHGETLRLSVAEAVRLAAPGAAALVALSAYHLRARFGRRAGS